MLPQPSQVLAAATTSVATVAFANVAQTIVQDKIGAARRILYSLTPEQLADLVSRTPGDIIEKGGARSYAGSALITQINRWFFDDIQEMLFTRTQANRAGTTVTVFDPKGPPILFVNPTLSYLQTYRDADPARVRFAYTSHQAQVFCQALPLLTRRSSEALPAVQMGLPVHWPGDMVVCASVEFENANHWALTAEAMDVASYYVAAFIPPEVVFPDVMPSRHYSYEEFDGTEKDFLALVADVEVARCYGIVRGWLLDAGHDMRVTAFYDQQSNEYRLRHAIVDFYAPPPGLGYAVGLPETLTMALDTITKHLSHARKTELDVFKRLTRFISGVGSTIVRIAERSPTGGFVSAPMVREGPRHHLRSWLEPQQGVYQQHHLAKYYHLYMIAYRRGLVRAVARYELAVADLYVRYIDVYRSLEKFNGHFKMLVYVTAPLTTFQAIISWLQSLSRASLASADIVQEAVTYLRRDGGTIRFDMLTERKAPSAVDQQDFTAFAFACVEFVRELHSETDRARAVLAGGVLFQRFKNMIGGMISDTVLGDFLTWLFCHSWFKRWVVIGPKSEVFLGEYADFGVVRQAYVYQPLLPPPAAAVAPVGAPVKVPPPVPPKVPQPVAAPAAAVVVPSANPPVVRAVASAPPTSAPKRRWQKRVSASGSTELLHAGPGVARDASPSPSPRRGRSRTRSRSSRSSVSSARSSVSSHGSDDVSGDWDASSESGEESRSASDAAPPVVVSAPPPQPPPVPPRVRKAAPTVGHHVDTCGCHPCIMLEKTKYPAAGVIARHDAALTTLALDPQMIDEVFTKLADDDNDVEGIAKVKAIAKAALFGRTNITNDVWLRFILGTPGCGKSHLIRALCTDFFETHGKPTLVVLPFNKLMKDYGWGSPDYRSTPENPMGFMGPGRKVAVVKTTHRACGEKGYAQVVIDECGALPYEFLAIIADNNPGATVYCVGDYHQTQVRGEEGYNMFNRLAETKNCEVIDLKDHLDVHVLSANYRNPPAAVALANRMLAQYYAQCVPPRQPVQMVSMRAAEPGLPFGGAPVWAPPMSATTLLGFDTSDVQDLVFNRNHLSEGYATVRSSQGSTFRRVALHVHAESVFLAATIQQALVALTRHTHTLIVVAHTNDVQIHAWLNMWGIQRYDQMNGPNPAPAATTEEIVDTAALPARLTDRTPFNAAAVDARLHSDDPPLEKDARVWDSEASNDRLGAAKLTRGFNADVDHALEVSTKSGLPKKGSTLVKVGKSGDHINFRQEKRVIQQSFLVRMNSLRKEMRLDDAKRADWQAVIARFRDAHFAPAVQLTPDRVFGVLYKFMEDAKERNYQLRLESEEISGVLGEMANIVVRGNVKKGLKVNNSLKLALDPMVSPFFAWFTTAAQTIAAFNTSTIVKDALTCRLLAAVDSLVLREGKGVSTHLYMSHLSPLQFKQRFEKAAERFPTCPEMIYLDGSKTDSGATNATLEIVQMYTREVWRRVLIGEFGQYFTGKTRGADLAAYIDDVYTTYLEGISGAFVDAKGIHWRLGTETPSGALDTFYRTSVLCRLLTAAIVTTQPGTLSASGGDDNMLVGYDFVDNPAGMTLVKDTCHVDIRMVRVGSHVGALEFCGLVAFWRQSGGLKIAPAIYKYYEKWTHARYSDEEHYGLVKKSYLDALAALEGSGNGDERTDAIDAHNRLAQFLGASVTGSEILEVLSSLARESYEQYEARTRATPVPVSTFGGAAFGGT